MGRTARTDVPEVIRYFEARKRKCQFANPGRKLPASCTSSIRSPSPSLSRRSNFSGTTRSFPRSALLSSSVPRVLHAVSAVPFRANGERRNRAAVRNTRRRRSGNEIPWNVIKKIHEISVRRFLITPPTLQPPLEYFQNAIDNSAI